MQHRTLTQLYEYANRIKNVETSFNEEARALFEDDLVFILKDCNRNYCPLSNQEIISIWTLLSDCYYNRNLTINSPIFKKLIAITTYQCLKTSNVQEIIIFLTAYARIGMHWDSASLTFRHTIFQCLDELLRSPLEINTKQLVDLLWAFSNILHCTNNLEELDSSLRRNVFCALLKLVESHKNKMTISQKSLLHHALNKLNKHLMGLEQTVNIQLLFSQTNTTLWKKYHTLHNVLPKSYRQFNDFAHFEIAAETVKRFALVYLHNITHYNKLSFSLNKQCVHSCALYQSDNQLYLLLTPAYAKNKTPHDMENFLNYLELIQTGKKQLSEAEKAAWQHLQDYLREQEICLQVISGVSKKTMHEFRLKTFSYRNMEMNFIKVGYTCGEPVLYLELEKLLQEQRLLQRSPLTIHGTAYFSPTFFMVNDEINTSLEVVPSCQSRCQKTEKWGFFKATNHPSQAAQTEPKRYVEKRLSKGRKVALSAATKKMSTNTHTAAYQNGKNKQPSLTSETDGSITHSPLQETSTSVNPLTQSIIQEETLSKYPSQTLLTSKGDGSSKAPQTIQFKANSPLFYPAQVIPSKLVTMPEFIPAQSVPAKLVTSAEFIPAKVVPAQLVTIQSPDAKHTLSEFIPAQSSSAQLVKTAEFIPAQQVVSSQLVKRSEFIPSQFVPATFFPNPSAAHPHDETKSQSKNSFSGTGTQSFPSQLFSHNQLNQEKKALDKACQVSQSTLNANSKEFIPKGYYGT